MSNTEYLKKQEEGVNYMAFPISRKQYSETYKAVYSVSIDTNSEYCEHVHHDSKNYQSMESLVPGQKYRFPKTEKTASYEELKDFAISILNNDLLDECKQLLDVPIIDIKVNSVYEGSIELFFTVVFGVISAFAGIKDLYDSIELLRTLAEKKLEKRFNNQYGNYFRIDVRKQIPRNTHYGDCPDCVRKYGSDYIDRFTTANRLKRDSFFFYLLVSNIVLLTIIVTLVAKAVMKVYW